MKPKRQQQQKQRKTNKNKHLIQFYQNGGIRFGLFQFENHKNAKFEHETMSLEERVDRDFSC